MLGFILKRLAFTLCSIPVFLWVITVLISFSPVDPIDQLITSDEFTTDNIAYAEIYEKTAKENKLDLPPFYFSMTKSNYNKAYFSIVHPIKKRVFDLLLKENYSFHSIELLYGELMVSSQEHSSSPFLDVWSKSSASELLEYWKEAVRKSDQQEDFTAIKTAIEQVESSRKMIFSWKPGFFYFGKDNAFHQHMINLFSLKWGRSLNDGKLAKSKIYSALPITFFLLLLSVICSTLLGVLLGIWFHASPSRFTKWMEHSFYILKSIPLFVFALFLLNALTTNEISPFLKLFPAVNAYGWSPSNTFFENLGRNFHQLILPLICLVLWGLPYITRLVKSSLNRETLRMYHTTARMKGLSFQAVNLHKVKNIRGIIVTIIGNKLIGGLAGALIIEYVFNIPGMGRLLIETIKENDINVLIPIALMLFVFGSLILLISDILYRVYNPTISFQDA